MPLPLTLSCFSKIQIGFTFLVPAYLGVPEKGPLNGCVHVCFICKTETGFEKLVISALLLVSLAKLEDSKNTNIDNYEVDKENCE